MNKLFLAATAAGVVLASAAEIGPVQAADLGRPVYKAPVMMAPVPIWSGWYAGVNVGYGWGGDTGPGIAVNDPGNVGNIANFMGTLGGNVFPNLNPSGLLGGGQIGYNVQNGAWVFGLVTDFQFANLEDSATRTSPAASTANVDESLSANVDWFGTVRGKVGYALDNWLLYLSGGLAYGKVNGTIGFTCTPGGIGCVGVNFLGSHSTTKVGWTLGGGVDYALGPNWSLGLEYLFVDLGNDTVIATDQTGNFPTVTLSADQSFTAHVFRGALNYRFAP